MAGLVLVFDLDLTLVDTEKVFEIASKKDEINSDELYKHLNIRLIEEVLKPAVDLKGSSVSAILLLSNNNLEEYVNFICESISRILGTQVFDLIVTRRGTELVPRAEPEENPPKRLVDVERMLKSLGKDSSNLEERVYFFDDLDHEIKKEIIPGHYYRIHNWLTKDHLNNYAPVKKAMMPPLNLSSVKGGKRTRKKKLRHSTRRLKRRSIYHTVKYLN